MGWAEKVRIRYTYVGCDMGGHGKLEAQAKKGKRYSGDENVGWGGRKQSRWAMQSARLKGQEAWRRWMDGGNSGVVEVCVWRRFLADMLVSWFIMGLDYRLVVT